MIPSRSPDACSKGLLAMFRGGIREEVIWFGYNCFSSGGSGINKCRPPINFHFHFHQDVGFSFMLDPRFPLDTLFITCEQDLRLYERDCLTIDEWLPMCVHTSTSQYPTHKFLSMTIEGAAAEDAPAEPLASWREREREEEQRKASSGSAARVSQRNKPLELDVEFSREIFDLVASCSLASRFGHREVVWFGYTCSNEKFSTKEGFVAFGSQGVCFTKG